MPFDYSQKRFAADCTVKDGVVRWNTNDQVPPDECLDGFAASGCVFDMEKSKRVREDDYAAFIAEYRRNARPPGPEELAEMRAAFGPGVEVVNIITGRRTRT